MLARHKGITNEQIRDWEVSVRKGALSFSNLAEISLIFTADEDEGKAAEENKALTTSEKLKEAFQEIEILFATPQLRKRTLNIFYSWLVVAMVYYGLSFNSKNIGGDM